MDPFAAFPDRVPAPALGRPGGADGAPHSYRRDPSRFAVRGPLPAALRDLAETRLAEADLAVVRAPAERAAALPPERRAPVYVLGEGGAPFVPTGLVSVRFSVGATARDRDPEIREAGYRIVDVPAYAPHFAWLEAVSGERADSLAGLPRLGRLPGVIHVEAQMLSPRATR